MLAFRVDFADLAAMRSAFKTEMLMSALQRCLRFRWALLPILSLLVATARAEEAKSLPPLAPPDTSSPVATLNSLIDSCNELHESIRQPASSREPITRILPTTERVLDCLDLSELPRELRETAGLECALFLKEVLDRIPLPTDEEVIRDLEAEAKDGKPPTRWRIPQTRIVIAQVERGEQQSAFLFTPESVRRASQFYRIVKALPYRDSGRKTSPGLHEAYVSATKKTPTASASTSSPRDTLTLFIDSCNRVYEEIRRQRYVDRKDPKLEQIAIKAISCLDTTQLREFAREKYAAEAAVCLKEVLDRVALPPVEEIPGLESLDNKEGAESLARWQVPNTQIFISRVVEGPRRGEFLFSAETVAQASEFYAKMNTLPYRTEGRPVSKDLYDWWLCSPGTPAVGLWLESMPEWFHSRGGGMAVWQWLGLIPCALFCLALILWVLRFGHSRAESTRGQNLIRYWLTMVYAGILILIPYYFKQFAVDVLTIRGTALYVVTFCSDLLMLFGTVGVIVVGSSRVAESIIALPHISPRGLDASVIRIVSRTIGLVAAVIVMLEGGRYLGFPLGTLIASAGIGGLAIALSAQGLIKGFFATVTILLDQPYRVGERILVNGHDGIVEEIGLRSTKIRALSNHLISIPNEQMAESEIENIGKRKYIQRKTDLHIPLDTPREKVEQAVASVRSVLENHEGMDPAFPPRVYFHEFDAQSFIIRIMYWYTPADIWQFLAASEQINFEIFRAFEKHEIQFSLPVRHSYWKRDNQQGPLEVELLTDNSAQQDKE